MSKIKILAIPSDKHGVGKYRIMDPYKFIDEKYDDIHVDITYNAEKNDDYFLGYDIVIFHTFIHQTNHEDNITRIKWLKEQGIKVIMDIDDLWFVDQRHPMYLAIKNSKLGEMKVEMMRLVDYVSTTTPTFADTIKKRIGLKDNVLIFPNAVNDEEPQFKPEPTKSELIRFGWLGGSSHLYDLEIMSSGISSIHNSYKNQVQFVLCGFDLRGEVTEIDDKTGQRRKRPIQPKETVWYKYEKFFTDDYKVIDDDYKNYLESFLQIPYNDIDKPYRRKWTQDINSYAFNYNMFDVSLAPLVESDFNANKSQLKVIEAGFHKKAIIASETQPFTIDLVNAVDEGKFNDKGNALLVNPKRNHKDWAKQMKRLIENPNMIEDLGNRLYETVKDTYSLKKVCKDRVQFFKSIINK